MKIDLNKNVKNIDGTDIKFENSFLNLGREIANGFALVNESSDPLKFWGWAQSLYNEGFVELDHSDLELFKNTIKNSKNFTVLLKGQALVEINKQIN